MFFLTVPNQNFENHQKSQKKCNNFQFGQSKHLNKMPKSFITDLTTDLTLVALYIP